MHLRGGRRLVGFKRAGLGEEGRDDGCHQVPQGPKLYSVLCLMSYHDFFNSL